MTKSYDAPFYKKLSRNDTGETGGHQGGIVLPKDLAQFFPHLAITAGPTADQEIVAELYDGDKFLGTAKVRYQIQTWGGERSPEHRLTRNLRPLLKQASADDALMFQRQLGEIDKFKLVLLHQGTAPFREAVRAGKYGVVPAGEAPATQSDFKKAEELLKAALLKPFAATEPEDVKKLSVIQRRVRTELFQRSVRLAYKNKCALCGHGMLTPAHIPEVEAAHIIPRGENGSNDARNGLALCRSHHWAFDQLLWTITEDCEVAVPRKVRQIAANDRLAGRFGDALHLPAKTGLYPAAEATKHHRQRVLDVWGRF